jgi:hypothetical protein
MTFQMDFVGLVCFVKERKDRKETGRLALLPDGRDPGGGIEKHTARLVVRKDQVDLDQTDWWDHTETALTFVFPIEFPSDLAISGLEGAGVEAKEQDAFLPRLPASSANGFAIDLNNARTIARLPIRAGTLQARQLELIDEQLGADVQHQGAIISSLQVDHEGPIIITATPRPRADVPATIGSLSESLGATELGITDDVTSDFVQPLPGEVTGGMYPLSANVPEAPPATVAAAGDDLRPRRLTIKEGAEIVLANLSPDTTGGHEETAHFNIYKMLAPDQPHVLTEPQVDPAVPFFVSAHPFFRPDPGTFPSPKCSNTGCC